MATRTPRAEPIGRRACARCDRCWDVMSWNESDLCPTCRREDEREERPRRLPRRYQGQHHEYYALVDGRQMYLPLSDFCLTISAGSLNPDLVIYRDGVPGHVSRITARDPLWSEI